ncbi:hypothetical protein HanRHA438_Chr11g0520541 [Helianthus annuus]|nr:hypothetical protein HanRHA438_Chr11g0520541 [Helianthus annuus]
MNNLHFKGVLCFDVVRVLFRKNMNVSMFMFVHLTLTKYIHEHIIKHIVV